MMKTITAVLLSSCLLGAAGVGAKQLRPMQGGSFAIGPTSDTVCDTEGAGACRIIAALVAEASPSPVGPALLPALKDDSLPFVGERPAHPFVQDATGALTRTLFSTAGPANTTVTVQDIMVGPQKTQRIAPLPGPALVEWFEGHGTFSVGGGPAQTIKDGVQVIPGGQPITITNPDRPPIGAHLLIFAGG